MRTADWVRLAPSRYLSVFLGERRLGIRLRRARGLMGRKGGKMFSSSLPMRPRTRLNLILNLLSPKKHKYKTRTRCKTRTTDYVYKNSFSEEKLRETDSGLT